MIKYLINHPVDSGEIEHLFMQVDWAQNRSHHEIQKMLESTSLHVTAWKGERLIGFLRVLTDGVYRAFIEDVIVDEDYRSEGVGKTLVQCGLDQLKDVDEIALGCRQELEAFYAQFGFSRVTHSTMRKCR